MRRALIIHSKFSEQKGGSAALTAWAVQSLVDSYQVTVLTWQGPVDLHALDTIFGTSLSGSFNRVRLCYGPRWLAAILRWSKIPHARVRRHLLIRQAKHMASNYDLVISCDEDMALGKPGIQYIHEPPFFVPEAFQAVAPAWTQTSAFIAHHYRQALDRFCRWLSDTTLCQLQRNKTLVNSDYMGAMVRERLEIPARTVYPPAVSAGSGPDWQGRHDAFLALGRFAPHKELEKLIEIIRRVREKYPVDLHLAGTSEDPAYLERLRQIAGRHSWLSIHCGLSRQELAKLMHRCRYGIHGKVDESFGMAGAEMIRAGCLVFLPHGGGQIEIVEGDCRLLYTDPDDAVKKITRVLGDEALLVDLRTKLRARGEFFSPQRFMEEFRAEVELFEKSVGVLPS